MAESKKKLRPLNLLGNAIVGSIKYNFIDLLNSNRHFSQEKCRFFYEIKRLTIFNAINYCIRVAAFGEVRFGSILFIACTN